MTPAGARLTSDGQPTYTHSVHTPWQPSRRLADLWQLPLLMVSLTLSVCAAYLFVDAKPALAFAQKIGIAKQFLRDERPEAAAQSLTRLVASERLPREHEAQVHLLLAESIDAAQKQQHQAPAANYSRILEELQIALAQGVQPSAAMHRRMGECYEALGKPADAASQYRQAMAIDPALSLRLQRKVTDLQTAASDWPAVEASLDAYLATTGVSDAERAWAENQKAQLLIDRGEHVDARRLLEDAIRLDADPIAQAQTRYRLGLCAWKTGKVDEAQALIVAARTSFNNQHPLAAAAAVALGSIAQEKNDLPKAIGLFDAALAAKPDALTAMKARLARAACRVQQHEDDAAVADLGDVVEPAMQAPASLKAQAVAGIRQASKILAARENFAAAIELIGLERTLEANLSADFHSRLATASEKRAEQLDQSAAEVNGAERVRRTQMARDTRIKSAESYLALSRSLVASGDKNYSQTLWKAVDLLEACGDRQAVAAALDLWTNERPDDSLAPNAFARLGKTYEALGQADNAIAAYQRLQDKYPQAAATAKSAVALARLQMAKDPLRLPLALKVLSAASNATDAEVKRDALLEWSRLECQAGHDAQAIEPLDRFAREFATAPQIGEVGFLIAECSSHLAAHTDVRMVSASASSGEASNVGEMTQAVAEKKKYLEKAASQYDKTISFYRNTPPTREEDKRFAQLAVMHRADCAYELGDFDGAVKLYDQASREQSDPSQVVAANIQIANAYFAMHKPNEARGATERAKQLLHKLPAGSESSVPMPAAYWEQWLKWTGSGGTW